MQVNDSNLELAPSKYLFFVLEWYANWHGFCKRIENSTVLNRTRDLQGQVAFGRIDAERNNDTTKKYHILAYPTSLIFKNGSLLDTEEGYSSEAEFASTLRKLNPDLDISRLNLSPLPSAHQNKPESGAPGCSRGHYG